MTTTAVWDAVFKTDPNYTKGFSRSGGFKGTATNALYLIHKATKLWGPMGGKWGVKIIEDKMLQGAPILIGESAVGHEIIHCVTINLFHPDGKVPAFGQTVFVGKNKNGIFTDEEAPKKSLTDATTKALSWLGFSADIHMGLYDDNKYVNDMRREFGETKTLESREEIQLLTDEQIKIIENAAKAAGKDIAKICKKAGVSTLQEIPAEWYEPILNGISTKTTTKEAA